MESKRKPAVKLSNGTVEEAIRLTEDTCRVSVRLPDPCGAIAPGQFFMLKGWDGYYPLLRRPFSVSDVAGDIITFVIKITGRGTRLITDLVKGESLSLLGPLGNGFVLHHEVQGHIFVAGGVGIAPFPLLGKALKAENQACDIVLLYGERNATRLIDTNLLGFHDTRVIVATEDGSFGRKGLVTEPLSAHLSGENGSRAVYACGPPAMLKAVQALVADDRVPLQFSLESRMGCGLGSCMGCVTLVLKDGKPGYSRVCCTGPVFDGREVVF